MQVCKYWQLYIAGPLIMISLEFGQYARFAFALEEVPFNNSTLKVLSNTALMAL